jgi:hypothetical protein
MDLWQICDSRVDTVCWTAALDTTRFCRMHHAVHASCMSAWVGDLHENNPFVWELHEMILQPNYFTLSTFLCGAFVKGATHTFVRAPHTSVPSHIMSYVTARACQLTMCGGAPTDATCLPYKGRHTKGLKTWNSLVRRSFRAFFFHKGLFLL